MSTLIAPTNFDVNMDGGRSNAVRWASWMRGFALFLEAGGIEGERKMIVTLLHVAGPQVQEIYEAIRDTTVVKANEKYEDIR